MKAEKNYEIKFVSIEMVSKSMEEQPFGPEVPQDFKFNWFVEIKVAAERKLVVVLTTVAVHWVNGDRDLAKFKTGCVFEFPEFEDIFKLVEEGKYDIPVELEILLKSTGLSTTRGMLHSEFAGTYLNGLVMPLVDISSLIIQQRSKKEEAKD